MPGHIPSWFLRELKCIDPRYFIEADGNIFNINYFKEEEQDIRTVETFQRLNDAALEWLRFRKWLGRTYGAAKDQDKWFAKLKRQRLECKRKETDQAIEIITAGIMKEHELQTRKHFT